MCAEVKPETEPNILKAYSMTIGQTLNRAIQAGEKFDLKFWARSPQSSTIVAILETTAPPIRGFVYKRIALSPDWKQYQIEGAAKDALPLGGAALTFHFALAPGTIELAGVELSGVPTL